LPAVVGGCVVGGGGGGGATALACVLGVVCSWVERRRGLLCWSLLVVGLVLSCCGVVRGLPVVGGGGWGLARCWGSEGAPATGGGGCLWVLPGLPVYRSCGVSAAGLPLWWLVVGCVCGGGCRVWAVGGLVA